MKRLYLAFAIVCSLPVTSSAQWTSRTTTTTTTSRTGNVAIVTTAPGIDVKLYVESTSNNGGDNTLWLAAPHVSPYHSHVQWGLNGGRFIRSARPEGRVVINI